MKTSALYLSALLVGAGGAAWAADELNLGPASTQADSTTWPQWSLAQAQQLAFQHNWDLLAAKSDVDVATAQKIVAREFPNPTLAVSTAKIGVGERSGTSLGNSLWDRSYDTLAAVNQLFEIGGKRASRQSSARAGFDAARARLQDARRSLRFAISRMRNSHSAGALKGWP